MKSVITGDLVLSSKLTKGEREQVIHAVEEEAKQWSEKLMFKGESLFYRGDSMQFVANDKGEGLLLALLLRLTIKKISHLKSDLRFAIGIGKIEQVTSKRSTSDGEAFRFSGKTLDIINDEHMVVKSANDEWNQSMNIALLLADKIIENWSEEIVEAVFYSLKGKTQKELAKHLTISQPAVHKRLRIGNYNSIAQLVQHFQNAVKWI